MNTRQLILETTLKLMIEKQNSIISIRQISNASGIAIGGIYHHFSNKEEIYNEITEKYYINFYRFDFDRLRQIKGNAKEKIHDAIAEIFKQKEAVMKIESIGDEIDYRDILLVLTANGSTYENYDELTQSLIKELREFLTEIIGEGQKSRQIRQDLPTEDIAESLIIMYMGIQYKWEIYLIDDMILAFEDNFKLEWEKMRFRE